MSNNYAFQVITPDLISTPYSIGNSMEGEIKEKGEQDIYTFFGIPGQKILLDNLGSPSSNLTAKLIDPNGENVFSLSSLDDNKPVTLSKEGTYSLIIDGALDTVNTLYSLRLLDLENASILPLNTTIIENFGESGQETKLYKLNGNKGDYLYFDSSTLDYYNSYSLYDQFGKQVFSQNLSSDYELALPQTGEYTLALFGKNKTNNNYEFKVVKPEFISTALTLGELVSGEINAAGEKDTYTFNGTVGQQLFLDSKESNNLNALLYAPSGEQVFKNSLNSDFGTFTLKESGLYRLVIDGDGNNTNKYSFTLSDTSKLTPININTSIIGTTPSNEASLYQFTGTQGQILNFDLDTTTWNAQNWIIYSPNNQPLTLGWLSGDFQVTLPSSGLYTLAINNNTTTSDYSFQVTDKTPPVITHSGFGTLSGTVLPGSIVDHKFTANAGTQIILDSINNTNSQVVLKLITPDNQEIYRNFSTTNSPVLVLPQTGEYTLQIYGLYPNSTGNYQFKLIEIPKSLRTPGTNYLELGGVVSGSINGTETKVYTFDGVEGLRLAFNGITGNNISATLIDPNGKAVVSKSNFLSGDIQPFTLTQNGLYHLLIEGEQTSSRDYSFQLLEVSTAPQLTFNLPISGSLQQGTQSQFYKFNGTAGERLYFDSLNNTYYNNNWNLYDPNNNLLLADGYFSRNLSQDFEIELPQTGEYALLIEGGTIPTPVNYSFRVFSYEKVDTVSIITPGLGEKGKNGLINLFPVKLGVEDGKGGKDIQDYNIRVWPDPENSNPVITSNAVTQFSINQPIYRYQVASIDPDNDVVSYQLIEGPTGSLIDANTGELLWTPEKAIQGQKIPFTVKVVDGKGGEDVQTFTVEITGPLGKIQGAVFDDLNGNGFRDSKLVKGDDPAIVLAIDISGSTAAPFIGPDGVDNVLEAQVAATKALVNSIVAQGLGDKLKIGLIPHNFMAVIEDMDPITPGVQAYTTATADKDGNGVPDIYQILDSYQPIGSNDFTKTLQTIENLVTVLPGDPNVIFMSDGYGRLDENIAQSVVSNLESQGIGITAFGIGQYSTLETLHKVDPFAIQLTDVQEFVDIFAGWDPRYAIEPFLENVSVYLDTNNNGQLDEGEPLQLTKKDETVSFLGKNNYYYSFENLSPGNYNVRVVVPNDAKLTAPSFETFVDNVTNKGESFTHLFGLHFGPDELPNADPSFLTTPPKYVLKAGESLVYKAFALDPEASPLTYSLITHPEGMSVDEKTGTVVWSPTAQQIDNYYTELKAEQNRLAAIGRGEYAPKQVTFNVLLRATDTSGGQALQYIDVTLLPENNPPVFTSIFPENLSPQVGKLFQYQAKAIDADGDTIQYSIVSGLPANAQFNPQTGLFQWTPASNQLGAVELKFKATDSQGGETLQTIQTSVINALPNTLPVINSTPRTNAKVGNLYLYQLPTTDADGDLLQFNLKTAPAGMTIDSQGMLSWTPQFSQIGSHNIAVDINDGNGGITVHSFSINVSNNAVNYAPEITSTPNTITNLDRIYQYQLTGIDPDGDALFWSLDNAPNGMVIDATSGVLSWQPSFAQIGEHTIAVRLTDSNGVYVGQEFSLTVNGINTPPSIISTPVISSSQNQAYRYQVVGKDPENDELNFSLGLHPEGMSIDTNTGLIQWTPTPNQIGNHLVDVIVRDTQGETEHQNYTVVVSNQKINHPPVISSPPVFNANVGNVYRYEVIANDEDGDALNYQLISAPAGMQINPQTGIITWDNPIVGNYSVVVGVDDGSVGNAQSFSLTASVNNAPIINSTTPPATAIPGTVYAYDVVAVDPDGGKLKFNLDPVSVSKGMVLDEKGRLRWTPSLNDIGNHSIKISIRDENGGTVEQELNLSVAADNVLPKVSLITNYDLVNLGEELVIQALATDNVKVDSLQVFVNDVPVAVDSNGIAKVSFDAVGDVTVKAIVKDSFGNFNETIKQVQVRDFSDVNSPVVSLNLSGGMVTAPVEIKGTVNDDSLLYYSLEVAPVNGGEFQEIFRGSGPVIDGVLGTFDPSILANDSYILRLTAVDSGGNSSVTEDVIDVAGDLKLGNFQLSFTDLEIPVAGIPITVTRTYDSLNSNVSDEFGYGWRLEFRDTDLRTSVKLPSEEQQLMGVYNPFKDGTRVYITLPGGKRTGFTFKPYGDRLNSITAVYGGDAARWYHPAFVADDGSQMTLSVEDVTLVKGAGTSEYYGLNGQPYNPADSLFGGKYKLTTSEGIVYEIDGKSGDLLSVTDPNGNQLTFSDAGIFSSSGKSVIFERDVTGRITAVVDPAGEKVEYEYDEKGDLVGVIDREDLKTSFEYGDAEREHFLTDIIDPLGRTGVRTEYDDSGRLKSLFDANGEKVELIYDPDNSIQKVKDVFGKETTYVYDSRGNVLTEIDPLGKRIDRTYNEDNNLLTETVITQEINVAGNPIEVRSKTEWTYDSQENKLSEKDTLGNVIRWTYNSLGQVLSETDALGNVTTYSYSPSGNLLSTKDANGNVTKFSYDARGNLLSLTDAGNNITRFTYDAFGNVLSIEDANRNQTTFTYDSNGNRLTETRTVTTPKGVQTLVTKSEYDSNGKVTKVTDAENKVTEYKYDESGNQIAVIDARNNKTEYRYDSKGQLVETIYPDNTPSNLTDNPRTINLYDKGGRLRATLDQDKQVTHYNYDDAGRLIETIYPDGEDTITQLVNALAPNQTPATIDWTQVIYPDVSPAFLSNNSRSKTEYYKNGDVKAEIDERGNRTEYRYDLDSRLIEVIYPDDTPNNPADNPRTKTEYDELGRTVATIDAKGQVTHFEYDNLGRLVKTIYPDATPNNLLDNPTNHTEYDNLGRRISATDAAGKTVYTISL